MDLTANELRCAHCAVFISSEYQVGRRLHFYKLQNAEILLAWLIFPLVIRIIMPRPQRAHHIAAQLRRQMPQVSLVILRR